jgi:hypothetical protein
VDLRATCGTISFVRWLIALVVSFAIAAPAEAGVFKSRGKPDAKPAAAAKKPAAVKKTPAKQAAAPKKATPVAAKTPAKKGRSSAASKGRPDDLIPDKKTDGGVTISEDAEDDVIIRDIDD